MTSFLSSFSNMYSLQHHILAFNSLTLKLEGKLVISTAKSLALTTSLSISLLATYWNILRKNNEKNKRKLAAKSANTTINATISLSKLNPDLMNERSIESLLHIAYI